MRVFIWVDVLGDAVDKSGMIVVVAGSALHAINHVRNETNGETRYFNHESMKMEVIPGPDSKIVVEMLSKPPIEVDLATPNFWVAPGG